MSSNEIAFITGASAGIGAAYAKRLAERGYDLVLVARNGEKLREVARETGGEILEADLRDPHDLARVTERLATDDRITLLVNNAGTVRIAPFADADIDDLVATIDLNVTAFTRLAHAAARAFVARDRGTIINVGSVTPLSLIEGMAVYNGTKAYVNVLTQTLAAELEDTNVRVQAVLPGAVGTELWDKGGLPLAHLDPAIVMPIDDAVDAALAGLDQGELITIPSLPDAGAWDAYEQARLALRPGLSRREPAARYQVTV